MKFALLHFCWKKCQYTLNRLTPNDTYMGRTTLLTSKRCILYIYSTNTGTEYFKHALYSPFFFLQNAVSFIMLTCLVPVLFTFYIQGVLKLKNNSGTKVLISLVTFACSASTMVEISLSNLIKIVMRDNLLNLYWTKSHYTIQ